MLIHGDDPTMSTNATIHKKINQCVAATKVGVVDTETHAKLFAMVSNVEALKCIKRYNINALVGHYETAINDESKLLANERATAYKRFINKAISHKGGQAFHRIIKKKVDAIARPVAKNKFTTTADQDHANEQIEQ